MARLDIDGNELHEGDTLVFVDPDADPRWGRQSEIPVGSTVTYVLEGAESTDVGIDTGIVRKPLHNLSGHLPSASGYFIDSRCFRKVPDAPSPTGDTTDDIIAKLTNGLSWALVEGKLTVLTPVLDADVTKLLKERDRLMANRVTALARTYEKRMLTAEDKLARSVPLPTFPIRELLSSGVRVSRHPEGIQWILPFHYHPLYAIRNETSYRLSEAHVKKLDHPELFVCFLVRLDSHRVVRVELFHPTGETFYHYHTTSSGDCTGRDGLEATITNTLEAMAARNQLQDLYQTINMNSIARHEASGIPTSAALITDGTDLKRPTPTGFRIDSSRDRFTIGQLVRITAIPDNWSEALKARAVAENIVGTVAKVIWLPGLGTSLDFQDKVGVEFLYSITFSEDIRDGKRGHCRLFLMSAVAPTDATRRTRPNGTTEEPPNPPPPAMTFTIPTYDTGTTAAGTAGGWRI